MAYILVQCGLLCTARLSIVGVLFVKYTYYTNWDEFISPSRFFLTEIGEHQKKEMRAMSRPFTPVHNSLFSKQVLDVDPYVQFL